MIETIGPTGTIEMERTRVSSAGCTEGKPRNRPSRPSRPVRLLRGAARPLERGQSLVETALILPLVLLLVFGVVGAGRLLHARSGVVAVARETARAAASANSAPEALARGRERGQAVAEGYGLRASRLEIGVDASAFGLGGAIEATVRYTVRLDDLPLLGWAQVPIERTERERVERYRSLWS